MEPTVEYQQGNRSLEIRSKSSAPNVTVYRPERNHWTGKDEFKVTPGYINASSFHIKTEQDAVDFKFTMSNAINELNEYNSVVEGWIEVENPWREMESLRRQVAHLKSEQGARETLARIKAAKSNGSVEVRS